MKRGALKTKKSHSPMAQGRSAGELPPLRASQGYLRKPIEKEDLKWLAELQTVLSPYWSARFGK